LAIVRCWLVLFLVALAGCGTGSTHEDGAMRGDGGADGGDGTPTRQSCTSHFGQALTEAHGRLDGYLVSIVMPGTMHACNDDSSHLHLQVQMEGSIYDVAVDTGATGDEIFYDTKDLALPDGAWSEGWHTDDALSYASLGVTSSDLTELTPTDAPTIVAGVLANVNHISVFGTGYGPTGMHLIHYESGTDGALVVGPLSATPQMLLFRFASDHF
jgi:hypothetical protein